MTRTPLIAGAALLLAAGVGLVVHRMDGDLAFTDSAQIRDGNGELRLAGLIDARNFYQSAALPGQDQPGHAMTMLHRAAPGQKLQCWYPFTEQEPPVACLNAEGDLLLRGQVKALPP